MACASPLALTQWSPEDESGCQRPALRERRSGVGRHSTTSTRRVARSSVGAQPGDSVARVSLRLWPGPERLAHPSRSRVDLPTAYRQGPDVTSASRRGAQQRGHLRWADPRPAELSSGARVRIPACGGQLELVPAARQGRTSTARVSAGGTEGAAPDAHTASGASAPGCGVLRLHPVNYPTV